MNSFHHFNTISGEKPDSNKENNNVPNGDKPRRGSNASRDRSDSRSRSKDKGGAAAAGGKNKRSSSKDSKAASRESTASNGRSIEKGRTGLAHNCLKFYP